MHFNDNALTRREFLALAAQSACALALAGAALDSSARAEAAGNGDPLERIGISDKAYRSARRRAEDLCGKMTLDEKIGQVGSTAPAIAHLDVPAYNYYTGEALHGLISGYPATSFPVPLALAATWNPELIHRVYTAVADEARAYDNSEKIGLSYYSPATLNLHRDPHWGRCSEAPGEDPCLAATIAVQMVRGMQGDDPTYLKTTPCSKHFICNNTDNDRTWVSANVDPRSFWEYYTRAYRATILDGDVFTVMGAYSAINGIPCCADHMLLTDLLRTQWGFRGYVTSDCDAVYNIYDPHHYATSQAQASGMAINAGCDLDCGGTLQNHLAEAVAQNMVGEPAITEAVVRLFTVRYLLGLFDPPASVAYTKIPFSVVDSAAHRSLALDAARQSLVLLKNENRFLPVDKGSIKKLAVIGPMGNVCYLGGYSGNPAVRVSPYHGICDALGVTLWSSAIGASQAVSMSKGVQLESSPSQETDLGFINDGAWVEFPKADFTGKTALRARVASASQGGRIDVHLDSLDGPLVCSYTVTHTGSWQDWVDLTQPLSGITGEHKIFLSFHGGGGYLLNVAQLELEPVVAPPVPANLPQVVFEPGCTVTGDKDQAMFDKAVAAARDADLVVMACGVTDEVDAEGHDRPTIDLTGAQPELVQAVYAANPKTVLVLSSNNSVAIEWADQHLPAILCAVCAGQAQGTAVAEAIFGGINPSGKLPCTWYRSLDQLPDMHDYVIRNGRTYMYFEGDPLYPFGFGLSYTQFGLTDLHLDRATLGSGEQARVTLTIANTGDRAGAEVVQLYFAPPASPVKRPIKQLVGFQRVDLQPGEKKRVEFELPYTEQALWYWEESGSRFVCSPGKARILVGNSSASTPLEAELTLSASNSTQPEPPLRATAVPAHVIA